MKMKMKMKMRSNIQFTHSRERIKINIYVVCKNNETTTQKRKTHNTRTLSHDLYYDSIHKTYFNYILIDGL